MPPGKPPQTPEQRALRLRAYELYLAVDQDGRRRSLRSIAMQVGVTLGTVQYWRKVDKWDDRVAKAMQAQTAAAGAGAKAIAALLRTSLYEHIGTLNHIARDMTLRPADRIKAVGELADIAIKLKAIDPGDMADNRATLGRSLDFEDDVHGTTPPDSGGPADGELLPAGPRAHDADHDAAHPDGPDHAGPGPGGGADESDSRAGRGQCADGNGLGTASDEHAGGRADQAGPGWGTGWYDSGNLAWDSSAS
jgi:hypothetical protein